MKLEDALRLERTFARLGPNGWEVPVWVGDLQRRFGLEPLPTFWVIDWRAHGL